MVLIRIRQLISFVYAAKLLKSIICKPDIVCLHALEDFQLSSKFISHEVATVYQQTAAQQARICRCLR